MDPSDPEMFERTVEPALARLALWVRRRGAPRLRADFDEDDVLQEVLARAWRLFGGFELRGPDSAYRWLLSLADGVLADRARYLGAKGRAGVRHLESAHGPAGPAVDPPAPGTSVTRLAARREARRLVAAALEGLEPGQREVVERHLLGGQSLAEIARALGVTKNAVWERLRRGLVRLRAAVPAEVAP